MAMSTDAQETRGGHAASAHVRSGSERPAGAGRWRRPFVPVIGGIVLMPGPKLGGVHAHLRGELVAILDPAKWRAAHGIRGGSGAKPECSAVVTHSAASRP